MLLLELSNKQLDWIMFIIQGLFLLAQFKDKLYKMNNHAQRDSVFSVLREYAQHIFEHESVT